MQTCDARDIKVATLAGASCCKRVAWLKWNFTMLNRFQSVKTSEKTVMVESYVDDRRFGNNKWCRN